MSALAITVGTDFIKIARAFIDAQKEAALSPTPRAKQKAEQLRTLFTAKLSAYEKQVERMEEANKEKTPEAVPFAKLI